MAKQEDLEMRIVELENQLKALLESRRAPDISKEDMEVYTRVRDALHYEPDFCGINDCMPCIILRCFNCSICQLCSFCDVECTCGPCNIGFTRRGALGRFSKLGG
jgi:hypothetical protein